MLTYSLMVCTVIAADLHVTTQEAEAEAGHAN